MEVFHFFWSILEDKKQGSSDHIDRIDLIEQFIKYFGKDKILCVIGDAEFIGKHWIDWLKDNGIEYVMCLRNSQYIANTKGEMVKAKRLFAHLKPGEFCKIGERKICNKDSYFAHVVGIRTSKDLIVLACSSNLEDGHEVYKLRWRIETMFKSLKSGGFNIEDTRIVDPDRIDVLLSVLAISYVLSYKVGEKKLQTNGIKLKKHGYKPKSIIREGIDTIIMLLKKGTKKLSCVLKLFRDAIPILRYYCEIPITKFVL